MAKPLTNLQDSVRQRLLNLAKTEQQPFDVVLVKYGIERVLLRLAGSEHRNRFVLKGGLLVTIWIDDLMRVTRDVDFLGYGDDDAETLKTVFKEILSIDLKDGLAFDVESLTAQPIRAEAEYGGTRLKTTAYLANTRIPITIDIGFGDAVVPAVEEIDYPHLLDAEVIPRGLIHDNARMVACLKLHTGCHHGHRRGDRNEMNSFRFQYVLSRVTACCCASNKRCHVRIDPKNDLKVL